MNFRYCPFCRRKLIIVKGWTKKYILECPKCLTKFPCNMSLNAFNTPLERDEVRVPKRFGTRKISTEGIKNE